MKHLLLPVLMAAACAVPPAHAQVYKWVDDKGVTHYGERPPQAVAGSRKLDIPLTGNDPETPPPGCYTIRCQYERMRADRLAREEEWRQEQAVRAQIAQSRQPAPTQRSAEPAYAPVYPVYRRNPAFPLPVPRPQPAPPPSGENLRLGIRGLVQ